MNRKTLQYRIVVTQFLAVCLLICITSAAWAQDSSGEFQKTKEDFLKVLGKKPLRTKGLQPKGPAEVVPDEYNKLIEKPTARSLILFDFDSDAVKQESYPILRNLADVLKKDLPDAKLVVAGHTDSVGTEEYNIGLSKRRAQSVKHVLVSVYAIDAERLIPRWFGESQPFTSNDTKAGRAQNRRVEFIRFE